MSDKPTRPPSLEWTGERYVPEVGGDIRLEHRIEYCVLRLANPFGERQRRNAS
jgi:hypothetical protein